MVLRMHLKFFFPLHGVLAARRLGRPGMKAPLDKVAVLPESPRDRVRFLPFRGSLFPPDAMRSSIASGEPVGSGHSWFCKSPFALLYPWKQDGSLAVLLESPAKIQPELALLLFCSNWHHLIWKYGFNMDYQFPSVLKGYRLHQFGLSVLPWIAYPRYLPDERNNSSSLYIETFLWSKKMYVW